MAAPPLISATPRLFARATDRKQAATLLEQWLAPYRDATSRLLGEAVASDAAWQRLAYLGDTFGHRLSGSPNLEAAIRWAVEEMKVKEEDLKAIEQALRKMGQEPVEAGAASL